MDYKKEILSNIKSLDLESIQKSKLLAKTSIELFIKASKSGHYSYEYNIPNSFFNVGNGVPIDKKVRIRIIRDAVKLLEDNGIFSEMVYDNGIYMSVNKIGRIKRFFIRTGWI